MEALNKKYFRNINQPKMSVYATSKERTRFEDNLPTEINADDLGFLSSRKIIKDARYIANLKLNCLFYASEVNYYRGPYNLFVKLGQNVAKNLDTGKLTYNKNLQGYPITYLDDVREWEIDSYGLDEGSVWGSYEAMEKNLMEDHLKPSILARYAMFERPKSGLNNVIVDSFIPRLMYRYNFDIDRMKEFANFPKTSLTVSEWFSDLFGIQRVHIEQMMRLVGFRPSTVKKLLRDVKTQRNNVVFIGYGGTNVNTIYWLTQLCNYFGIVNLFKEATIFEDDYVELSNMLRFPKSMSKIHVNSTRVHKLDLLEDNEMNTLANKFDVRKTYFHRNHYQRYNNCIIYGAPNLTTRQSMVESEYLSRVITATHSQNSCYIHANPQLDVDIQIETYGLIPLASFFMNQFRMAIGFLEIMAAGDTALQARDSEFLNYTFTGEDTVSPDRKYNFQLQHSGLMMTAEEANAIH